MDDLKALRERLDEADRRLVDGLAERLRLVQEVARIKGDGTARPKDPEREAALLARVSDLARERGLNADFVIRLYQAILDHSVRVQDQHLVDRSNPRPAGDRLRVGYQGAPGAYSSLAAARHFSTRDGDVALQGFETFSELLEAVRDDLVDRAVLPIENTTAGSINESYDLLARMDLHLVGEEIWKVEHCLLALRQVPLSQIRRVRSHPQALAQCGKFLRGLHNCLIEAYTDTAMACQALVAEQDLSQAAIASEQAGEIYGLEVLRRGIADQEHNYTRFVVVAREPVAVDARIPCKTSIVFATRHEEGALLACLNALARHHLNLTKLESRPRPMRAWEYLFYADFEGNLADGAVQAALEEVRSRTGELKVLGCYPSRPRPE